MPRELLLLLSKNNCDRLAIEDMSVLINLNPVGHIEVVGEKRSREETPSM